MPRRLRVSTGGLVYHVLNRAVGRATIFRSSADFEAFERVIGYAHESVPTRIVGYTQMPNHFHLVLWPREDGELSEFMRRLTVTHTQRWHANRHTAGTGPLYQGRFKSFPIEQDEHLLMVLRYVDRNALRAKLVKRAEEWRWGGLWHVHRKTPPPWLSPTAQWPMPRPRDWLQRVNTPQTPAEEAAVGISIRRGRPYGSAGWAASTAKRLGLQSTMTARGRPKTVSASEGS